MYSKRALWLNYLVLTIYGNVFHLSNGTFHGESQLQQGRRWLSSSGRRTLTSSANSIASSGDELIAALSNPTVEQIFLIGPVINVPSEAWSKSGLQLPIALTRNISIYGHPDEWTLLRLHYARDKVRLVGNATWNLRYVIIDGAFGENMSRESGFQILSPTPPNQTSTVMIGPQAAITSRFCIPTLATQDPADYRISIERPASSPGAQEMLYNLSQAECANRPEVPPLQRCWARKALIVDVLGPGVRLDASDKPMATNIVFWMRNVTVVCEIEIDQACLQLGTAPLVCYLETVRKYGNDTSSQLDDYLPQLPQQQQLQPGRNQQQKQQQQQTGLHDTAITAAAACGAVGLLLLLAVVGLGAVVWNRRRQQRRRGAALAACWTTPGGAATGGASAGLLGASSSVVVCAPALSTSAVVSLDLEPEGTLGTGALTTGGRTSCCCSFSSGQPGSDQDPATVGPRRGPAAVALAAAASRAHTQKQQKQWPQQDSCSPVVLADPLLAAAVAADAPVITPDTQPEAALELHVRLREAALELQATAGARRADDPAADNEDPPPEDKEDRPEGRPITNAGKHHKSHQAPLDSPPRVDGSGSGSSGSCSGGSSGAGCVVQLLAITRGKGAFGRVVEGLYGGQRVAVKLLACEGPWGGPAEKLAESFAQEVQVLSRCRHPNVVRLLAACVDAPRLCLVLELMETSLERVIHHRGAAGGAAAAGGEAAGTGGAAAGGARRLAPASTANCNLLPLSKVLHISLCIANALSYLHPTIVHRDLKPANVLINNPDSDRPVVKLTDFGLSRLRVTVVPTKNPDAGTPAYMAPECFDLENCRVTHKADVYSLGVLIWEMLVGALPWAGLNPLAIALLVCYKRARLPVRGLDAERCPPKLSRLLKSCWESDPDRRPAAAEVAKELALMLQLERRT